MSCARGAACAPEGAVQRDGRALDTHANARFRKFACVLAANKKAPRIYDAMLLFVNTSHIIVWVNGIALY